MPWRPTKMARLLEVEHWEPAEGVLACTDGDLTVLLSVYMGRYHTLDEVGGRVWNCLGKAMTTREIATAIADEFTVCRDIAEQDIRELLRELYRRGLLRPRGLTISDSARNSHQRTITGWHEKTARLDNSDAIPASAAPVPSVGYCLLVLMVISVAAKVLTFRRVWRLAQRRAKNRGVSECPNEWLDEAAKQITLAATLSPVRARCLEQSLCLIWCARNAGIDAYLRLGVQPSPFMAHAWVEYRGTPVNETPERLEFYRPFPLTFPELL
jgi:hypothetical protein